MEAITGDERIEENHSLPFFAWIKNLGFEDSFPGESSDSQKDILSAATTDSKKEGSLPAKDPTLDDVDSILAKELNKMKIDERELAYEELHGVDKGVEETPEFVAEKLSEFGRELQKISYKPAYNQAESISREYATGRKLRLMFLRAECFDPIKAAKRFVYFFQGKLDTFGKDALARPLYLTDLDKDDMACLKAGHIQMLPARDPAGRSIFCDMQNHDARSYKRVVNMKKTFVYLLSAAAEDEETQRRGFVIVMYHMFPMKFSQFDRELFYNNTKVLNWLPIRITGCHFCYNDPLIRSVAAVCMLAVRPEVRARSRVHHGTHTECQYIMMTFGVPTKSIPISYDGTLKVDGHKKWLAKRKAKDKKLKETGCGLDFEGIDVPGPNDILLGRGKPFQDHAGNMRLHTLVDLHRKEYDKTRFGQKADIAEKVLEWIEKKNVRFLKQSKDGWWMEVGKEEALAKVIQIFRTTRSTSSETSYTKDLENRKRAKMPQEKRDEFGCIPCVGGGKLNPPGPSF